MGHTFVSNIDGEKGVWPLSGYAGIAGGGAVVMVLRAEHEAV
jgi:hypothetical protein